MSANMKRSSATHCPNSVQRLSEAAGTGVGSVNRSQTVHRTLSAAWIASSDPPGPGQSVVTIHSDDPGSREDAQQSFANWHLHLVALDQLGSSPRLQKGSTRTLVAAAATGSTDTAESERLPEKVSRFPTQGFLAPSVAPDNRSQLLRHNLLIDKHEKKSDAF